MMWKALRFWFYRLFIVDCVGCGSLVVHGRGLCLSCEYHILDHYLSSQVETSKVPESELPFRFLFHWIPGESRLLSSYVYLLKSPLAEPLWHELSRYFVPPEHIKNTAIFVPIPSRKKRKHSLYLAQGLVEQFGGEVIEALQTSALDSLEQKQKSKKERRKISFTLNEEFTERLRLAPTIVLVDDVITTGASYEAAYNVLKNHQVCPENIELWAAFHREVVRVNFE